MGTLMVLCGAGFYGITLAVIGAVPVAAAIIVVLNKKAKKEFGVGLFGKAAEE